MGVLGKKVRKTPHWDANIHQLISIMEMVGAQEESYETPGDNYSMGYFLHLPIQTLFLVNIS